MPLSKRQAEHLFMGLWYHKSPMNFFFCMLLFPLSVLFGFISSFLAILKVRMRPSSLELTEANLPVIVVGNISVGGTGKTPIIINLAKQLIDAGYQPAIISRGYGGTATRKQNVVIPVYANSDPNYCGEESVLIAQSLEHTPVIISASRASAYSFVASTLNCNVVLSDDGLQHYQLPRSIEIAVIDSTQGLGNGLLIPAGPLRERASRLDKVDYIILNGPQGSNLPPKIHELRTKLTHTSVTIRSLREIETSGNTIFYSSIDVICERLVRFSTLYMVAGIGNPEKFFTTVNNIFLASKTRPTLINCSYSDHHRYTIKDACLLDKLEQDEALIMTAKDAVKLQALDYTFRSNFFIVDIETMVNVEITTAIISMLKQK